MHASTAEAIRGIDANSSSDYVAAPDSCEVFTDGSFDGVHSAWAIVVVNMRNGSPVSVGWAGSRVCTDRQEPAWIGADRHGALEAEETALSYAMLWVILKRQQPAATMRVDSICAMKRSTGDWQHPESDVLAHSCRSLAHLAEALGAWSSKAAAHVKSHVGHAWNELADVLAKSVLEHDVQLGFEFDLGNGPKRCVS